MVLCILRRWRLVNLFIYMFIIPLGQRWHGMSGLVIAMSTAAPLQVTCKDNTYTLYSRLQTAGNILNLRQMSILNYWPHSNGVRHQISRHVMTKKKTPVTAETIMTWWPSVHVRIVSAQQHNNSAQPSATALGLVSYKAVVTRPSDQYERNMMRVNTLLGTLRLLSLRSSSVPCLIWVVE